MLENLDYFSTILGGGIFVGEKITKNFIKNAGNSIKDMQKTFLMKISAVFQLKI